MHFMASTRVEFASAGIVRCFSIVIPMIEAGIFFPKPETYS